MKRNFFEDRMNDLYCSVQDGSLENYYALEEYLSERGYRKGFYGIGSEEGLDSIDDDQDSDSMIY